MGLYPCVHGAQFDVTDGKLNLFLNQRSNDTLAAGSWNVVQYSALVYMLAQVCNLKLGKLSHMIVNSHIYDRHMPYIVDITLSRAKLVEERLRAINLKDAKDKLSPEAYEALKNFKKHLSSNFDYDSLIKEAQELEIKIGQYDLSNKDENHLYFCKDPIDFEKYVKDVTSQEAFERAQYIVDAMASYPEFEELLSFKSPKLILDINVTDFYKFISPKTKDKDGKIIDNPNSSFFVQDYDYLEEGVKLQSKVPVAE